MTSTAKRQKAVISLLIWSFLFVLGIGDCQAREPNVSTTTYVGKHFEVREYEAPTKYVFNGNTRVARVTGSLTATNARVQRLRVAAGWNLCSLAVTAPKALAQLSRESFAPIVLAAYQWNPATGGWDVISSAGTVTAGSVLWLNAATSATLRVAGIYPGPSPNLRAPPEGAFLPGLGLEVLPTTNLSVGVTAWGYYAVAHQWNSALPPPLIQHSAFAAAIPPGGAFYAQATVSVEFKRPDPALSLRYYHQDHLGSSSALTDAQGNLVEETATYPFGHARHQYQLKSLSEPYRFTQKEQNAESGLYYFEARYLASNLGRFTRVDPLSHTPPMEWQVGPQQLNQCAYAANNPLRFRDPSGKALETAWDVASLGMGVKAIHDWDEDTTFVEKALDVLGVGADAAAAAVPFVPGGASVLIKGGKKLAKLALKVDDAADADKTLDLVKQGKKAADEVPDLPKRTTNPKHHPSSNSPEPKNVDDLFKESVVDRNGVRWSKGKDGTIHRFSKPSNGETHWNGSTSGPEPIRKEDIPIEIRRQLAKQ